MGRVITCRELGELVHRAATGFQAIGVGPGVPVGLYLPNTPQYPTAFFGVLRAGGTVVNYSPLDAERVLAHKVEDSETDVLVTLDMAVLYRRWRACSAPRVCASWSSTASAITRRSPPPCARSCRVRGNSARCQAMTCT